MVEVNVIAEPTQPVNRGLQAADILIAITSFNDEQTIAAALRAARAASLQFPKSKAVIVQVDGGSSDSTMQRAKDAIGNDPSFHQISYPLFPVHKMEISYHAVPGKDSAYHTIFSLAEELDAKACCVVSGDITGITPAWLASLLEPVLEMNFDLVTPFYQRHKYDGFLLKGILYPLVRALFGKQIRQPIGRDFGFSRALIRRCLSQQAWNSESARREIDLWISAQAIEGEMKLCQAYLGPRSATKKDAVLDASAILASIVGALYFEMEHTAELWQHIRGSLPLPAFGLRFDSETDPPPADVKPLIESFLIGCRNLEDVWGLILPPTTLLDLRRMSRQSDHDFHYPDELWARTVYDFAVAHRLRSIARDHLLHALTPLYMGWIGSFILSVRELDSSQVEDRIERLCMTYESQKPYLISRWRWPDRFMP